MPTRPFQFREVARYAPYAIGGGALIGFLIRGMRWEAGPLVGAIIGFSCFAFAVGAEYFLHGWLERRPEQWWRRALVYFVASQIGWNLPVFVVLPLFTGNRVLQVGPVLLITILLSVVGTLIGLSISGYEKLKDRLQKSIEELKEKEFADKELQLARELQARMLPASEIVADGYRISGRNFAARYVAGDFFEVFHYADGAVGIAVADVAGKGLAASLIMASVKAVLPLLASTRAIDEAMVALNEKLVAELSKREFVAMSLLRYEPWTGRATVANAGLPDPYLVRRGGDVSPIEVPGPRLPLGLKRKTAYQKSDVALEQGDALLLFSDGLPEATKSDGEQIGYDGLVDIIRAAGPSADEILNRIHAVETGPRDDDQTIVILSRVENRPAGPSSTPGSLQAQ